MQETIHAQAAHQALQQRLEQVEAQAAKRLADTHGQLHGVEKELEAARKDLAEQSAALDMTRHNLEVTRAELEGLRMLLKEREDEKARMEAWRDECEKRERDALVEMTKLKLRLEDVEKSSQEQAQLAEKEANAMNARLLEAIRSSDKARCV
jgi:hypothetical protein